MSTHIFYNTQNVALNDGLFDQIRGSQKKSAIQKRKYNSIEKNENCTYSKISEG